MRIVHLVAGAGGMYCGSCLQGAALARAMLGLGEDTTLAAFYTPLRTDEEDAPSGPVYFGGINVALQQVAGVFAHMPRWLARQLDRQGLLRFATRLGGAVDPVRVARLCVSMLQGEEGRQRAELERLIAWLADEVQPEVVHLNTILLAGVAREIRRRLGVPVVATVGGEDVFLDRLAEPHRDEAKAILRTRAAELDAIVALNHFYAQFMSDYLAVPRDRIAVIPPGIDANGYLPADRPAARASGEKGVGFLARITPDKGLHLLTKALPALVNDPRLTTVRIVAAGYLAPDDRNYLKEIRAQLADCRLGDRFEYIGEVDFKSKTAFLQSIDALCLPTVHPEAKGLPVLEAWACGVPVIVPRHGAFSEMLHETPGGVLFTPGDAVSLAVAVGELLGDARRAEECGRRGRQAVLDHYNIQRMARQTLALYRALLAK